ncbi:hypothetical protein ACH4LN_25300 [Streptomyces albus]|uniref:hypothetical protein n=1 Tax=Streptomyces albus TaxID=1888 RepID=UPI0013B47BE8|nr:hypothetical protein [Streptomyces albus]QID35052.1 hypothetical protein G3260_000951 [Streptomyces albus]
MSSNDDAPRIWLDRPDSGGHGPTVDRPVDLASSPGAKKKAAGYIENRLAPGTKTAGAHADLDTSGVIGAAPPQGAPVSPSLRDASGPSVAGGPFQGWALRTGLSNAHAVWEKQVKNLLHRLTSERDALRGADNKIHGNDTRTGEDIRSAVPGPPLSSKLNDY